MTRLNLAAAGFGVLLTCSAAVGQDKPQIPASPASAATPTASAPAAVPSPPVPVAYGEAVQKAANALLTAMPSAAPGTEILIDPLIDGLSGAQNAQTVRMGQDLTTIIRQKNANLKIVPFTRENVRKNPLVLMGTFRPVNSKNEPAGAKDAYHICLTLLDMKAGKVTSKGIARATLTGVNATPTAFFLQAPVYAADPVAAAYVKTCQGTKIGDPIDAAYKDRLDVSSVVAAAINAYNEKKYAAALALYKEAQTLPGGDQLRVLNGLYLANWKLGRTAEARTAFDAIIDYGLKAQKLAVTFLFNSGSTQFYLPKNEAPPYTMWLAEIANRVASGNSCLEVVGHTSKSGPAALNERLSVIRAEAIRVKLIQASAKLDQHIIANGVGARETIVGTSKDGPDNAVDRRVEFKPIKCSS